MLALNIELLRFTTDAPSPYIRLYHIVVIVYPGHVFRFLLDLTRKRSGEYQHCGVATLN